MEITNEMITKVITSEVKECLDDIGIEYIAKDEVRNQLSSMVKNFMKSEAEQAIRDELDEIISGTPIRIDDGWGNKDEFGSFSDLYKQELRKHLKDEYKVRSAINDAVKKMVADDVKDKGNQIILEAAEKIAAMAGEGK